MTKLTDENYAAKVGVIDNLYPLKGLDNLQGTTFDGFQILVGKETKLGDKVVYFPAGSKLSPQFLYENSLYRTREGVNKDESKSGMFNENGRVKAIKLRGFYSEGFILPVSCLSYLTDTNSIEGSFNEVEGEVVCSKYVRGPVSVPGGEKKATAKLPIRRTTVDFPFNNKTLHLQYKRLDEDDYIEITRKYHGTSFVVGVIPVTRELTWFEKILKFCGLQVKNHSHHVCYSSRKVLKGIIGKFEKDGGYYSTNIYGEVARELAPYIPKDFVVYGEIVGYVNGNKMIQPGYAYGCAPGIHKIVIYRIAARNSAGEYIELAYPSIQDFVKKVNLPNVIAPELFYAGTVGDFESEHLVDKSDHVGRIQAAFIDNRDDPDNPGMPEEGIVVKILNLFHNSVYKLKNPRFKVYETKVLDENIPDMEEDENSSPETVDN